MDYGALIGRAWQLTLRYRFLWLLGLFAGGTVGSCSPGTSYRTNGPEVQSVSPTAMEMGRAITAWLSQNLGVMVAIFAFFILLGLAWLIISLIAQGAMARATLDLARGLPVTLGAAWSTGLHYFGRFLLLWLILIGLGILMAVAVGIVVTIGGALAFAVESLRVVLAILGVLALIVGVVVGIAVAVLLGVVVAYAQRVIVHRDAGPWQALVIGYELLRLRFGPSLLLWLISLALTIGAGIAVAIVAVVALIPLAGVAAIIWFTAGGLSILLIVYAALAAVVFLLLLWTLGGAINTYFWNYWTLAYLQLSAPPPGVQQV
ncbi:MAG: hypothetical protein M1401_17200 [Chloroflexi bacterium]|nr:hypothetical protein [Chloroflexota bacterium]